MIYAYRFGFGKWAVLSVLFIAGVAMAIERYHGGFDPNRLPPPAAGIPLQQSAAAFPCEHMIYGISVDGVRYVHEAGGGTSLRGAPEPAGRLLSTESLRLHGPGRPRVAG